MAQVEAGRHWCPTAERWVNGRVNSSMKGIKPMRGFSGIGPEREAKADRKRKRKQIEDDSENAAWMLTMAIFAISLLLVLL